MYDTGTAITPTILEVKLRSENENARQNISPSVILVQRKIPKNGSIRRNKSNEETQSLKNLSRIPMPSIARPWKRIRNIEIMRFEGEDSDEDEN